MSEPRESIILSSLSPPAILTPDSHAHASAVSSLFPPETASLLEQTVRLKATLRKLSSGPPAPFWRALMRGITDAAGAQYAFAVQRVADGEELDWGGRETCALSVAFYCAEAGTEKGFHADYEYDVYGGPCQWMKENRVLLIAEGLEKIAPAMVKKERVPVMPDAYLAVPLWGEDGKCFGHFGMCWTKEGGKKRRVGWGELEMFLHAFEDVVAERMMRQGMEKQAVEKEEAKTPMKDRKSAPPELLPGSLMGDKRPSLRPYARRLSHELRTPMQGVVGMLDVMYATVMEATDATSNGCGVKNIKEVIDGLKANIEVAQDSSKRAVDAADNMVQAYDFNMEIPATPSRGSFDEPELHEEDDYSFPVPDNEPTRGSKRRRDSTDSPTSHPRNKIPHLELSRSPVRNGATSEEPVFIQTPRRGSRGLTPTFRLDNYSSDATPNGANGDQGYFANRGGTPSLSDSGSMFALAAEPVQLRSLLHEAVHYSLRTGGRPEAAVVTRTPCGECVTVKNTTDDSSTVHIEIKVEPDVPDNLILDGAALTKIISAVFHNAFKFTPEGSITLHAELSPATHLLFTIKDTGTGIPADFVPEMFKPFSREDDSLTRDRDGLGLGLMVAKSIARKMFGELWCEHTSTEAPSGTEFRIHIPINPPVTAPTTPAPQSASPEASVSPSKPASIPPTPKTTKPRALDYDPTLGKKLPLRILVVEDNRINRQLLCNMLRKLGYTDVCEARDGEEAVQTFINTTRQFDLILMDLWMPKLDGFDAAEQIGRVHRERSDEDGKGRLRIVAVSADATEEARTRARGVGIDGFVGKPFTLRELGRAVTRWGSVC